LSILNVHVQTNIYLQYIPGVSTIVSVVAFSFDIIVVASLSIDLDDDIICIVVTLLSVVLSPPIDDDIVVDSLSTPIDDPYDSSVVIILSTPIDTCVVVILFGSSASTPTVPFDIDVVVVVDSPLASASSLISEKTIRFVQTC
jgi:hypothetical protein